MYTRDMPKSIPVSPLGKPWYRSKTIQKAVVLAVAGIATAVATEYELAGLLLVVNALVDVYVRFITKDPISG